MEAVKTYKMNPSFQLGTVSVPTWITPLVLVVFVSVLVPNTSFLGHLCGLAFGYGCMLSPSPSSSFAHFISLLPALLCRAIANSWASQETNLKTGGLGYLKFLAPPEWALRWIEGKLNLLGRLPHYVSVDQKTYGRFGVLPTTNVSNISLPTGDRMQVEMGLVGSSQRLGP